MMTAPRLWAAAADLRIAADFTYHVVVGPARLSTLPDGRAGLVWLSDGTLRVCGPETQAWRPDRRGIRATGLRLASGAADAVLGVPAVELLDRRVELREIWGERANDVTDRLSSAEGDVATQIQLMESLVRSRLREGLRIDPVARHVARRLRLGSIRISSLAREVGLSERQLHRRSVHAFGYGPSTLARVLRLQRFLFLGARPTGIASSLADLAAWAGYSDQAHLGRECRMLTGSPASVLVSGLRSGSARVSDPFKPGRPQSP